MRLAFFESTGTEIDRIVRLRAGNPVHVELLFENDDTFSSIFGQGTRFTRGGAMLKDPGCQIIDIGPRNETVIRAWCEAHEGEKYGVVGCICYAIDVPDIDKRHPFCSQVCVEGLQSDSCDDMFAHLIPYRVSPRGLYLIGNQAQLLYGSKIVPQQT